MSECPSSPPSPLEKGAFSLVRLLLVDSLMQRVLFIALAVGLLAPRAALAQGTPDFSVGLISVNWNGIVGERRSEADLGRPFNAEMCADPANVEVVFSPSNPATGDLNGWISNDPTDCTEDGKRSTNPSDSTCENLRLFGPVLTDQEVHTTLARMSGGVINPCANTSSTGAAYRLYLFAAGGNDNYLGDPEVDLIDWGFLGAGPGIYQFTVDTQPPPAPVIDQATVSGRNPTISWSTSTGNEVELTYVMHVDTSGAGCSSTGPVDGGALDAGAAMDGGALDAGAGGPDAGGGSFLTFFVGDTNFQTSGQIPLEQAGLTPGETVSVYLTALDFAKNPSALSAPVCATFVETGDFCSISGACGDACNCSAPGASRATPLWPLAAIPFVGLWFARRRRTH